MRQKAGTIYVPGGDNHLVIYYSDEADVIVTMMVNAYMMAILEAKIPGVKEVTNAYASLMVHFDPMRIRYEDLLKEVKKIEKEWEHPEKWAIDSKLFEIPVWFDDPWSTECYLAHKGLHQIKNGSISNFAYCAKYLGLTKREFIEELTSRQYLIFCFGFAPGMHGLFPLVEKQDFLTVPKYEISRPWSPPRVLCAGGASYSIHPYVLPGGLQMIGSTPVPMSSIEPTKRILPTLQGRLTLANLGDRFKLRPVGKEEYEETRAKVRDGTYQYKINYQKWEPKKWLDDPKGYTGTPLK
jgi:urea carboxylase